MKKINDSQIYAKLTKGLSPKTKDIFDRRFGVKVPRQTKASKGQVVKIETLESIGKSLGITRERVRQIEEVGFTFVRKNNKETLDKLFGELNAYLQKKGGFAKEEVVLEDLGGEKNKPYVLFLLTLGQGQFSRVCGKKEYHYFWASSQNPENRVKETLYSLVSDIKSHGNLLTDKELFANFAFKYNVDNEALNSYLEISKRIQKNKEGKIGLIDWPEIKPRGVKDKAFLVFKDNKKPLHFRHITELIDKLEYSPGKKTHAQTVHNELIKDERFVLVGRGTYALSEWGYVPGTIKDIITKVLKEKQEPAHQEDIVKEVLSQRLVTKNTILMNLNNKKYFQKSSDGKYFLIQTQVA